MLQQLADTVTARQAVSRQSHFQVSYDCRKTSAMADAMEVYAKELEGILQLGSINERNEKLRALYVQVSRLVVCRVLSTSSCCHFLDLQGDDAEGENRWR